MHQIRSVTLNSYLDVAAFLGIDGHKMLCEVGISPLDLDRTDARLPAAAAVELLERSANGSGCDSFGIRMAQCRSFPSIGPLSLLLERLDDISAVLYELTSMRRQLSDVLVVGTEVESSTVLAKFEMIAPYGQPQAAALTLALGYMILAGASQGRWSPDSVHFTHGVPRDRASFESFFQAPLVFNSDFNGLASSAAAMKVPLPLASPAMAGHARRLLQIDGPPPAQAPTTDHARHSIALLLPMGKATLSGVAKNLGVSNRGVQRQLDAEGHNFAGLVKEVRRDMAARLLRQSNQNLTEIAHNLGYANLSAFSRWFEREFNDAPSNWRRARASPDGPRPDAAAMDRKRT